MLKGAQKKMYVVKLGQDSLFEEAYFVLKRENGSAVGKDMISEATRIIRQSEGQEAAKTGKKRIGVQAWIGFACGLVAGAGIAVLICLLL